MISGKIENQENQENKKVDTKKYVCSVLLIEEILGDILKFFE